MQGSVGDWILKGESEGGVMIELLCHTLQMIGKIWKRPLKPFRL